MRTGLLRALDVPETIDGYYGDAREAVLRIGEELIRQKERGCVSNNYFNPPCCDLYLVRGLMSSLSPSEYANAAREMIKVYEIVLKMTDEIMGKSYTSQVCEMKERIIFDMEIAKKIIKRNEISLEL
jgi:hypothetical protein